MKIASLLLCGGFGSRLGIITKKTPKPLIKINNMTFIEILINYLKKKKLNNFYLSTFYKPHLFKKIKKTKIINERTKLGSGGAIIFCVKKIKSKDIFITNGDTIIKFNLKKLLLSHEKKKKILTILTTSKKSELRYNGFYKNKNKLTFNKTQTKIKIDCGAYIINKIKFLKFFKKIKKIEVIDIINILLKRNEINIVSQKNVEFIDIGILEDLKSFKKNYKKIIQDYENHQD
jgi:NDP-sugar pyrophosphorylase family protein